MNKLACRSLEVHVFFESLLMEHNFVRAFGKWFDVRYPELSNLRPLDQSYTYGNGSRKI